MKSLLIFLTTILLSLASNDNSTQPQPPPASQVQYDETPQLVKEKTVALPPTIPQTQLLSPNVQTQSIILPPSAAIMTGNPHIVRGFNLDNIDPELEIVKPIPVATALNKNNNLNKPKENAVENKGELPKMNNEANLRLNKTHNLSKKKKNSQNKGKII